MAPDFSKLRQQQLDGELKSEKEEVFYSNYIFTIFFDSLTNENLTILERTKKGQTEAKTT